MSNWCNATFLQICSDDETNSSTSWMACGCVHFQQIFILGWTIPLKITKQFVFWLHVFICVLKRSWNSRIVLGLVVGLLNESLFWNLMEEVCACTFQLCESVGFFCPFHYPEGRFHVSVHTNTHKLLPSAMKVPFNSLELRTAWGHNNKITGEQQTKPDRTRWESQWDKFKRINISSIGWAPFQSSLSSAALLMSSFLAIFSVFVCLLSRVSPLVPGFPFDWLPEWKLCSLLSINRHFIRKNR